MEPFNFCRCFIVDDGFLLICLSVEVSLSLKSNTPRPTSLLSSGLVWLDEFFFFFTMFGLCTDLQDTLDLSWELFCKGTKFEQLSSQLNSGKKCFVTVIWHLNKFTERMWYQCGKEFQRIESVLGLLYHWFLMCFFTKILTTHAKAFEKAVLLHMWHFFFYFIF